MCKLDSDPNFLNFPAFFPFISQCIFTQFY